MLRLVERRDEDSVRLEVLVRRALQPLVLCVKGIVVALRGQVCVLLRVTFDRGGHDLVLWRKPEEADEIAFVVSDELVEVSDYAGSVAEVVLQERSLLGSLL